MDKKALAAQMRLAAAQLEQVADDLEHNVAMAADGHVEVNAANLGSLIQFITTILPLIQQLWPLIQQVIQIFGQIQKPNNPNGPVAPPTGGGGDTPPDFGQ